MGERMRYVEAQVIFLNEWRAGHERSITDRFLTVEKILGGQDTKLDTLIDLSAEQRGSAKTRDWMLRTILLIIGAAAALSGIYWAYKHG